MKYLLAAALLSIAANALASIECNSIVRALKSSDAVVSPLVQVTAERHKEEFLGKSKNYFFYTSHNLQSDEIYMDILNPAGDLVAKSTTIMGNVPARLLWSDSAADVEVICLKIIE